MTLLRTSVGLLVLLHEVRSFQGPLVFAPMAKRLVSNANKRSAFPLSVIASQSKFDNIPTHRGENNRLAYKSTGSACLNLFQGAVKGVDEDSLLEQIETAWEESPDNCVRLIFHLGDIRHGGKMDKKLYYQALMWMYETRPKSFVRNLKYVPKHTCWKDLLNLLMFCHAKHLASKDQFAYDFDKDTYMLNSSARGGRVVRRRKGERRQRRERVEGGKSLQKSKRISSFIQFALEQYADQFSSPEDLRMPRKQPHPLAIEVPLFRQDWKTSEAKALWVEWSKERSLTFGEAQKLAAKIRRNEIALCAKESKEDDGKYREVYGLVADSFATALQQDASAVDGGLPSHRFGGLAAKWAPTPGGMHDKNTAIVAGIVERLYPAEEFKLPEGTYDEYLSFMTDRYRKEYLVRLRAHAEIPEHFIGTGRWGEVNYRKMPSRCRYIYGETFRKHDTDRYDQFLLEAANATVNSRRSGESKKGAAKVAAGTLFPHEIVQRARFVRNQVVPLEHRAKTEKDTSGFDLLPGKDAESVETEARLSELKMEKLQLNQQWASLVDKLRDGGKIGNCLAVCDVSGSMSGEPMDVAVSLSLLLAEIAEEPWRGLVCTFSEKPILVQVSNLPESKQDSSPTKSDDNGTAKQQKVGGNLDKITAVEEEQDKPSGKESLDALMVAFGDVAKRSEEVMGLQWNMNTNFVAVFDRLLETAVRRKLEPEAMVKTVFVFSDMEFDSASRVSRTDWATAHEEIERKFAAQGYSLPTIVYWNLRGDSQSIPVTASKRGTVLVGGFSAGMMKAFLENQLEDYTPFAYLAKAVLDNPAWAHLSAHPDDGGTSEGVASQ